MCLETCALACSVGITSTCSRILNLVLEAGSQSLIQRGAVELFVPLLSNADENIVVHAMTCTAAVASIRTCILS